ncbi:hypothetical protein [Streptomyces sp. NPDC002564]|uniref:hypothetical protein n=1 Tax=Streptomyces sp. NPDC002564 TaxID=3364649 RepID=UPI00369D03C9
MADDTSCEAAGTGSPVPANDGSATDSAPDGGPFAECVLCRAPTEYPESRRGITLCPVCEWQEAQRSACPG